MVKTSLIDKIKQITIWSRFGERALNKPLLLLLALSKMLNEDQRLISYVEVDQKLGSLLEEFGPKRSKYHPEYPFWRLQNDGIWEVVAKGPLTPRKSNTDIPKSQLIKSEASGGFDVETYESLKKDKCAIKSIINNILDAHFPSSIHNDILSAVGLEAEEEITSGKRRRCPDFREKILSVYGHRCAFCGFDLRIGNSNLALEAAHIKWHQAGGPDIENNGMALCVLHHKLFDRGAMTIDQDFNIMVSVKVNGSGGTHLVDAFHGKKMLEPKLNLMLPAREYIHWHNKEVFREPSL